jgi:hypothetical protein
VEDMFQLTSSESEELMAKFSKKEVREAIFQMKHNKAPGPDGFPAQFYQVFWSLIKDDLMAMFRDFHARDLHLLCLNFGIITLIPKEEKVKRIQQYRPICMLNVSFKIFTKVMANRLMSIACRITKPSQSAFLPGRYILKGVVVLHETIHELKRKKQNVGVAFIIKSNRLRLQSVQRPMGGTPNMGCYYSNTKRHGWKSSQVQRTENFVCSYKWSSWVV